MKKALTILVALAVAVCFSLPALAADAAKAPGPERGQGYHHKMTPEQRAEYKKVKADFLNDTMALRQQLAAKRVELKTLLAQPTPDGAKIKAVADEKVDLLAQVMKKYNEYLAKYPQYFKRYKYHHDGWDRKADKDRPRRGQPPAAPAN
ncbi:MAG: periplasmic heavy metal sensor [Desulfarculus sp.]|nr:periplasmic heavy metal sensor [Desulfarculus sp.]